MIFNLGEIRVRKHMLGGLAKGDVVMSHKHNFGHPTFVHVGGFRITEYENVVEDAHGRMVSGDIARVADVWADSDEPWAYIKAGVFHTLESLQDGSRYACLWLHRRPSVLTPGSPGQLADDEWWKRDDDGVLWNRIDETVETASTGWEAASTCESSTFHTTSLGQDP